MSHIFLESFMLNVRGLACVRGDKKLFSGLDLSVRSGEWLHIQGQNGAGKTSLLRLLAGLSMPAEGEICWNQISITDTHSDFRSHLLYFGHHGALKEDLTALENLTFASVIDGVAWSEEATLIALKALYRLGLKGRENLPVRVLSAGQKRRVMLARLLTRQATLWILDEPFTALDVAAVDLLSSLITEHVRNGGMAVLTSHQTIPMPGGQVVRL
jgi:heme exporter protein A